MKPHSCFETLDWGRTSYRDAWERQKERLLKRQNDLVPDALIFTEHDPVFTLGVRRGAEAHLVWSPQQTSRHGIEVVRTNRGGDITYHGPGQLVGYPIVSLLETRDLHAYLRLLEQVLIETTHAFGLDASRREGKTGIWVGKRKVAAIGVSVKKWVTCHGFAININNDLTPFSGIVPCGIEDGTVTSLQKELGFSPELKEVKTLLAETFWNLFYKKAQRKYD